MKTETGVIGSLTAKLIACFLIVICFAVGAVGLVLPIIPGLLFVAIALMLVAKFFPPIDRFLRRSRTLRSYLDSAAGFGRLAWPKKLQYGGLLCLRLFVDAVAFLVYVASRLLGLAVVKYQSYR
jgi:uncharacterized membrane protein YbaN (DUF454 family)